VSHVCLNTKNGKTKSLQIEKISVNIYTYDMECLDYMGIVPTFRTVSLIVGPCGIVVFLSMGCY
jgi:hypothetical protein